MFFSEEVSWLFHHCVFPVRFSEQASMASAPSTSVIAHPTPLTNLAPFAMLAAALGTSTFEDLPQAVNRPSVK